MSYLKWNDKSFTKQEKELIKGIQRSIGADDDGYLGPHTLASFYRKFYPEHRFSMIIDGVYVIFSNKFKVKQTLNKENCSQNPFSISGTFQWKNVTSSMVCIDGDWKRKSSTHDWLNQPETVIYSTGKEIKTQRCILSSEIKDSVQQAVGGLGLHNYNPTIEGFIGPYADVLRKTGHTAIGYDGIGMIGAYFPNHTAEQVRAFMMNKVYCELAIMLDGGHIAACNTPDNIKNGYQLQNNIIVF